MQSTQTMILVRCLAVKAHIGVSTIERDASQTILVDIEVQLRNAHIEKDEMSASLNYAEIIQWVEEICKNERMLLLEILAEKIAAKIFETNRAARAIITVSKPRKFAHCESVGVRRTFVYK